MKTLKTLRSPIPHARNNCINAQSMSPSTLSMQVARRRHMRGRSCFIDVSDEKVHIGLFGSFHIACHTSHGDVVEQFLALDAHHVHRHLAGDKLYPVVDGLLPERFQGIDSLLLHQVAHHPGSDAQHVHLRESQLRTVGGQHPREHASEEVFLNLRLAGFLDGIQSPEGEEDAHLFARGGCPVGEDEGGERLVKVIAEENERLSLCSVMHLHGLRGTGGGFLYLHDVCAALGASAQEAVARGAAPCLGIPGEACIGGPYLQPFTCL